MLCRERLLKNLNTASRSFQSSVELDMQINNYRIKLMDDDDDNNNGRCVHKGAQRKGAGGSEKALQQSRNFRRLSWKGRKRLGSYREDGVPHRWNPWQGLLSEKMIT